MPINFENCKALHGYCKKHYSKYWTLHLQADHFGMYNIFANMVFDCAVKNDAEKTYC